MKHNLFFFLMLMCLTGCQQQKEAAQKNRLIERAAWIEGNWETRDGKFFLSETWRKTNDSLYEAVSVVIVGSDTVFREDVRLEQQGDDLFYIVSVKGQNQEKPVAFKLKQERKDELRFENPQHDFPTTIVYRNPVPDSLVAYISGPDGSKKQTFPFRRKR